MADKLLEPYIEALDEFPLTKPPAEQLRAVIKHAVLAPSSHNTQPWLFRVAGDAIALYADRSRALPVVDPNDRELVISCGAALFNLRAALRHFGREVTVALLPDANDPDLLARVALAGPYEPSDDDHALFRAIATRRTFRLAFESRAVPEALLAELRQAALEEGAWLEVLRDETARNAAAYLIAQGDRVQMTDKRFRRELAEWVRPNRTARRDGMPGWAHGFGALMAAAAPLVMRTFDIGKGQAAKDRDLALGSPVLAVLGTDGDEPGDWLAAGQALERVLLHAQAGGVSASFLNQPVEVPELRLPLQALTRRPGFPQVVLRLGYEVLAPA